MNLAVELHDAGQAVGFIDAEPKGPTASVLNKIEPAIPTRSATSLEAIDDAIAELRGERRVLVIDTPGTSADELIGLCLLVDFVLIPLQPSDKDLQQVKPFLKLIKAYQINTGGKPEATIVFTFTRRRDVTARSYRRELSPLGIEIARTEIRRLDDYRDNHIVMRELEHDARGAAGDIRSLVAEVIADRLLVTKESTTKEVVHG